MVIRWSSSSPNEDMYLLWKEMPSNIKEKYPLNPSEFFSEDFGAVGLLNNTLDRVYNRFAAACNKGWEDEDSEIEFLQALENYIVSCKHLAKVRKQDKQDEEDDNYIILDENGYAELMPGMCIKEDEENV